MYPQDEDRGFVWACVCREVGGELTTSHHKNAVCYEMVHRASDLKDSFE